MSSVFLLSRITCIFLKVLCMSASIAAFWSDISPQRVSSCASALLMVVSYFSIGSSDAVTSTLYLSKALSSSS